MEPSPQALDVSVLVEQVAPLRRLARQLVWQDADADDLVQDAALTALESGSQAQQPVAWLKGVVRGLARKSRSTAGRHNRLDRRIPLPEAAPGPDQVMETLELQRRLATVLIELGEPYRTALHMRYFQDRPPREIAAVLGMPLHSVKTHLSRGLEKLRRRLDAEHGGSRRTWQMALAPLAGVRPEVLATAATGSAAAAGPAAWGLLAAAVLVVGLGALLLLGSGTLSGDEPIDAGGPGADVETPLAGTEIVRLRGRAPDEANGASRRGVEAGAPGAGDAEAAGSPRADTEPTKAVQAPIDVLVELRDGQGNLLPHVLVEVYRNRYLRSRKDTRLAHGRSDARGMVRLEVPTLSADTDRNQVVVSARMEGQPATAREVELEDGTLSRVALTLYPPRELPVHVEDPNGRPVAGAICTACFVSEVEFVEPSGTVIAARTNDAGRALLVVPDHRERGRFALDSKVGFRIRAQHPAYVDAWSGPIHGPDLPEDDVTIRLVPGRDVVVRVLTANDEPRAAESFGVHLRRRTSGSLKSIQSPYTVQTDDAGEFRVERAPRDAFVLSMSQDGQSYTDTPIEPDTESAIVRLERCHRASFRVFAATSDEPAVVHFTSVVTDRGAYPDSGRAYSVEAGVIEAMGLVPGSYMLYVWLEGRWGTHRHRFRIGTGSSGEETIRVPEPEGRTVEIRVRTADDESVPGAICYLGVTARRSRSGHAPFPVGACIRVPTDATGCARAVGMPAGAYSLHVRTPAGRTVVVPVAIDQPDGAPVTVVATIVEPAVLNLPVPDEYVRADIGFKPQVIEADGARHFPATPAPGTSPSLEPLELRAGVVTVIPETREFETVPFAGDPYAVKLDLLAGETQTPRWPAVPTARARIVVRDEDGSPLGGRWCTLVRVEPGQTWEALRRHRFKGGKQFLLGDDAIHVAQGLLPGSYFLVVHETDYRGHPFEVSAEPEQTVRLPR